METFNMFNYILQSSRHHVIAQSLQPLNQTITAPLYDVRIKQDVSKNTKNGQRPMSEQLMDWHL